MPETSRPVPNNVLELRIASDPRQVGPVRRTIEAFARGWGFDPDACQDIGLCVNEALANVIRHAYGEGIDGEIHIRAEAGEEEICIRIRDWGSGSCPRIRAAEEQDPLEPGGLGLICLRELTDELKYEPQPDGMLLTLVRRRMSRRHRCHSG